MILRLLLALAFCGCTHAFWEDYFTDDRHDAEQMCLPSNFSNSKIYCGSKLIEAVNYHALFNDSKSFVDSPLLFKPDVILDEFEREFGNLNMSEIDPEKLNEFVEKNFDKPTSELTVCVPDDWHAEPKDIMKIQDPTLRDWALKLNEVWKDLCREINSTIKYELDKHSIIWVDNKFIIPGGRFREFYYWDTLWIIKGLLVSGMYETAKGMARNLGSMKRFGFVPNGGRIYYRRSQPPVLSHIVYTIYEGTDDINFVKEMLPLLEQEFQFWENNRKFPIEHSNGKSYDVYFYRTNTFAPRPESMRVDLLKSAGMSADEKRDFFQSMASAAESGWDFSSRWFADQKNIQTIETAKIAPIDLNSYMCFSMDILHYLYEIVGDQTNSVKYAKMHNNFLERFDQIFYNKTAGAWYDYNTRTGKHIVYNYPSIATPLFTDCYDRLDEDKPKRLFNLLLETGFFNYSGGIPTSLIESHEQWDFPNKFSLSYYKQRHIIIEGLRKSSNPSMQDKAFDIAVKWITGNYKVYNKTNSMFEKYNVIGDVPEPGGGGEYSVQTGFGWSNGIILDLMSTYYDRINLSPKPNREDVDTSTTSGANARDPESNGLVLPALALLNIVFSLI
ncbi:Trehalase [Aphelenchoides bicaudatus]|nr:Trehalase [Aphelenchoides bicaudatus]